MRRSAYYSLRLVFCILFLMSLVAWSVLAQDWEFVDVSPGRWSEMDLNDVFFIGGQGWAVGEDGAIVHTSDGTRWHDQNSGVNVDLYGVHFEDTLRGWVVGALGVILNTEDGGTTWKLQDSLTTAALYDIDFGDDRYGWIVGGSGAILYTENYGRTWKTAVEAAPGQRNLNALDMYGTARGWAVGNRGTIFRWNGTGWLEQTDPSLTQADLHDVHFTSVNEGWIVGDGGVILRTGSAGAPWASWKDKADAGNANLRSVHFTRNQKQYGWIVGDNGTIVRTSNSGGSWFRYNGNPAASEDLNGLYSVNNNEIWAVGDNGSIIKSPNRGQSWEPFVAPPYGDFLDVSFDIRLFQTGNTWIPEFRGWIVGDDGVILKLQEDGVSWREYPSPTSVDLHGLHMHDKFNLCAVGRAGTIIRSNNPDIAWQLQDSPTEEDLHGTYLVEPSRGWAVGNNGTICHLSGATWTLQASNVSQNLHGVFFVSNSEGWVVGDLGTVLYTSNGGLDWTWVDVGLQFQPNFREVYFFDRNNGWIVGDGGIIVYWNGAEFAEQNSNTNKTLYDVDFLDDEVRGWIAAADRMAISTPNDGTQWDPHLVTPALGDLYGIDFAERTSGFAVGVDGTIVMFVGTLPVAAIQLLSPVGNVIGLSPTFRWETDNPNLTYKVFIDNDVNPYDSNPFLVTGSKSFELTQPLPPGTYYWGIEAPDGTRSNPSSQEFTLWPPTEVTLISPSGHTSEASPTFEWDCNNKGLSEQGLLTYTLFIDDDDTPYDGISISVGGDLSHTLSSADPLSNLLEGQYTWGVETAGLDSVRSDVSAFTVDLLPPTGAVEINDGAEFTNSLQVTLTLTASDPISIGDGSGIGVTEMQFSNDGVSWSAPEAFAGTKIWDLSLFGGNSADGQKTVYARFKDALGHWMVTPVTDTISVDTVPPTGTIAINGGAAVTGLANVTLSLSGLDDR
ncbi:YCF48-related protein, partial [Candidatus Poribacteria bacterium]